MQPVSCRRRNLFFVLAVIAAIALGIIGAIFWHNGALPYTRAMIPYAIAFAMLIMTVISIIAVKFNFHGPTCEEMQIYRTYGIYFGTTLIAAAVHVVFGLLFLASYPAYNVRYALAFVGSISFWIMLLTYIETILCITRRK